MIDDRNDRRHHHCVVGTRDGQARPAENRGTKTRGAGTAGNRGTKIRGAGTSGTGTASQRRSSVIKASMKGQSNEIREVYSGDGGALAQHDAAPIDTRLKLVQLGPSEALRI